MLFCSALDTSVTPLTDRYFGFSDVQNGYILISCGTVSFISYYLMQLDWAKEFINENQFMLFGNVTNNIVVLGMMVTLCFASFRAYWIFVVVGLMLLLFAFAVPYINVGCISTLNKFSPQNDQSKLQGVRSSLGRIAKVNITSLV